MPAAQKPGSNAGFLGRRVEVFWEQEGAWFPGVVVGRRNTSAFGQTAGRVPRDAPLASRVAHHVAYDDGDYQWHHLEVDSGDPGSFGFRWLDAQQRSPTPPMPARSNAADADGERAASRIDTSTRNPLGGRPNSDKYRAKSTVQMTIFQHSADPASVVCYPEVWKNGYFCKAEAMQGLCPLSLAACPRSRR